MPMIQDTTQQRWLLLIYRVPQDPPGRRTYVWRQLKELGAIYLQQAVGLLPDRPAVRTALDALAERIRAFEGEVSLLETTSPSVEWQQEMIRRFNQALDGGTFIRLRDLVTEELDVVIDEGRFHPFSASAWAMTYFLIKTPNEQYRSAFKTLEDRLKTAPFVMGNTDLLGHQYFMEAFGETNLDRLERDWMDFMERLSIEDQRAPALPEDLARQEEADRAAAGKPE